MNIYFVYFTFNILVNEGGPMGIGYIVLPFLILENLLIIPAILVLFKKYKKNKFLLALNIIGTVLILSFIIITTNFK
jgi:hypothetical protein